MRRGSREASTAPHDGGPGGWGPSCHPAPPWPGPLLRAGELVGHPKRARMPRGGAHRECRRCVPSLGARFGAFLSGGGARSRTSPWAPATVLKSCLEDGVKVWGSWARWSAPGRRAPVFPPPRVSATRPRVRLLCHRGRLIVARLLPVESSHTCWPSAT
jgi:hypothetical protein